MAMLGVAAAIAFAIGCIIYLADTGNLGLLYAVYDFPHGDKVGHVVLLGLVTFPTTLGALSLSSAEPRRVATWAALVVAVLITVEEASQAFLPSRALDPFDLLASYLGIVLAAWLALTIHCHRLVRKSRPS